MSFNLQSNLVSQVTGATAQQVRAETATDIFCSPKSAIAHRGIVQAWGYFSVSGGVVTLLASYNISSITRVAPGTFDVFYTIPFSTTSYAFTFSSDLGFGEIITTLETRTSFRTQTPSATADPTLVTFAALGEQ